MPRTKRRFDDDVPESDDSDEDQSMSMTTTTTAYPRQNFGGGKQIRYGGGGKQIRTMPQESEPESSESDEESEEEEVVQPQTFQYNRGGGGKVFRPAMGGGKILRYPASDDNKDDDDDQSDEEQSDEEQSDEEEPEHRPYEHQIVGARGGGKGVMRHPTRNAGKMLRPRESSSSDDDSENDEPEHKPIIIHGSARGGGGKSIHRPQPDTDSSEEENNDGDEDGDEDSDEDGDDVGNEDGEGDGDVDGDKDAEDSVKEEENDMDVDSEPEEVEENEHESEPEAELETKNEPEQTETRRTTRQTKKEESEAEDMDESSDEQMEESEASSEYESSESEDEPEFDDMDTLDQNDLIEGEADQKYLDGLPEIERESILAQRFEKRKAEMDMKKALRENKRREREKKRLESGKSGKTRKRKTQKKAPPPKTTADATEEKDDNNPDTTGDLAYAQEVALGRAAKTPSGVEAKRKAALDKLSKDRRTSKNEDDSEDTDYGEENDDEDSDGSYAESQPWKKNTKRIGLGYSSNEDDYDDDMGGKSSQKAFVEAELQDFLKVTIPRRRLSRWCNEPYFEKSVINFYVRLAIGRDRTTQKPCYRLCKIVGVKVGKEYQFPPYAGQKQVTTNKWINLKFGDSTKYFKMITVSDSRPDDDDVTQFLTQLKNRRGGASAVLSKKEATSMRKKQDNLINTYTYTTEDIQKQIQVTKDLKKKVSNIGAEKTRVNTAVQASRTLLEDTIKQKEELETKLLEAEKNEEREIELKLEVIREKIEDCEEDLGKKIEEQKKILSAETSRKKQLQNNTKNQKWAKVNRRAIEANKTADVEAYKAEIEKKKSGKKEPIDPYARRKAKPVILWDVGQTKKEEEKDTTSKDAEKKEDDEAKRALEEENNDPSRDLRNGLKKKLSYQMNDMSIDEEAFPRLLGNNKKNLPSRVRKGLSLSEYFERKAAGTL